MLLLVASMVVGYFNISPPFVVLASDQCDPTLVTWERLHHHEALVTYHGDGECVVAFGAYNTHDFASLSVPGAYQTLWGYASAVVNSENRVADLVIYDYNSACKSQLDVVVVPVGYDLSKVFPQTLTQANQGEQSIHLVRAETLGSENCEDVTPTPTNTSTPTSTSTDTPTATNTPTNTPTPTPTSTNTATNTPTQTSTPSSTPTATSTSSSTPTSTATATMTPEDTPTNTPTPTATNTSTQSPTPTSTSTMPCECPTNTPTSTLTPTPTETLTVPCNCPTDTPTSTATSTATATQTPTSTATPEECKETKEVVVYGEWKPVPGEPGYISRTNIITLVDVHNPDHVCGSREESEKVKWNGSLYAPWIVNNYTPPKVVPAVCSLRQLLVTYQDVTKTLNFETVLSVGYDMGVLRIDNAVTIKTADGKKLDEVYRSIATHYERIGSNSPWVINTTGKGGTTEKVNPQPKYTFTFVYFDNGVRCSVVITLQYDPIEPEPTPTPSVSGATVDTFIYTEPWSGEERELPRVSFFP